MASIKSLIVVDKDTGTTRYKGVYPCRSLYRAIVLSSARLYVTLGHTFPSQEEAAQAVADWYEKEFGKQWEQLVKNRRNSIWRVRRVRLHRGLVEYWLAEVKVKAEWVRVCPSDISDFPTAKQWSDVNSGWCTRSAAIVAVRIYRSLKSSPRQSSPVPARTPSPSS